MRTSRTLVSVCLTAALAAVACGAAPDEPVPAAAPAAPPTAPVRITIVHTNDLHGHIENFPAVAAVAKAERKRNTNTLFLDGGDCITGTPVSTVFQGTPIFHVMNLMGYDAGTIGNHEFDHAWEKVHEYVDVAKHPVLCANAKDPSGKPFGDAPFRVLHAGGVRVGVIGLVTSDVPTLTAAKASAGCTFERPVDVARRLVPEVRKQADLVVLLTHCGVEVDAALAGSVEGVDLIVGGHSHTRLERALDVRGTKIVQAGDYGRCVGIVDLTWDPAAKRVTDFAARLRIVEGEDGPEDAAVRKEVDSWLARVAPLEEVIGKAPKAISRRQLRPLLERIYKDALGADFGYQNAAGIRDDVEAGDVSVADLYNVLPFDNTLVTIRLKGDRVPEFARKQLGAKFDPAKEYVVATNSYVGDQREKYFRARDAAVEDSGKSMRDVVIAWVRAHGGFSAAGEPLPADAEDRAEPR